MTDPTDVRGVAKAAIAKWGRDAQIAQAIEELAELAVSLSHLRRGRARAADVVDEVVDVTIMLEQVIEMLGPNGRRLVDARFAEKLRRLADRIDDLPAF